MAPIGSIGAGSVSFRPSSYGRFDAVLSRADAEPSARQRRSDLRSVEADLSGLRDSLRQLLGHAQRLSRAGSGGQARAAAAGSQSALAIGAATYTSLQSTGEINAIATSYSPFGPVVDGDSTSLPTIAGVYDGSQGDDVLSFEFRQNRSVPTGDSLTVRVKDGSGNTIDNLDFSGLAPGTPVALSNGLTLSLSEGQVERKDTFEVNVFTSIGSSVYSGRSFDGVRDARPNFEPGFTVSAGTFEVNGETISVSADDSIDSVLAKISASPAAVNAVFDAGAERIVLTSLTPGSEGRIEFANDTSGFLAATKLSLASEVRGSDPPDNLLDPIAEIAALSGISAGLLEINGVSLAVDPDSDSLADVIERINSSGAGAEASFDTASQRFSIRSTSPQDSLLLSDGNSGFFSALDVEVGVHDPLASAGRALAFQRRTQLREDLVDVARSLNGFLERGLGAAAADLSGLRENFAEALSQRIESLGGVRAAGALGIEPVDGDAETGFLDIDSRRFEDALRRDPEAVHALLFGSDQEAGLLSAMEAGIEDLQARIDGQLGRNAGPRRLVDLFA